MSKTEEPNVSSPSGESKARTPAYANFDSNTDKVLHFLQFIVSGVGGFKGDLESKVAPEAMRIVKEFAQAGPQPHEASHQEAVNELVQNLSDTLKPIKQFTDGFLTAREWIPVLLVTTVEAYLEDLLIYVAKLDSAIMESARLNVPYAKVVGASSLEELKHELNEILPPRWAKNFVADGGPTRWITELTKMGARGYGPETAKEMETLWGVRHLIVHSGGVATTDFVRRHPEVGLKAGESILIRSYQLIAWIKVAYHFVDVTDFFFVQRYGLKPE